MGSSGADARLDRALDGTHSYVEGSPGGWMQASKGALGRLGADSGFRSWGPETSTLNLQSEEEVLPLSSFSLLLSSPELIATAFYEP